MSDQMINILTISILFGIGLNALYIGVLFGIKNAVRDSIKELAKQTELLKFMARKMGKE